MENLQTLQIAQANFRNMLDELERYPDLDTTEALVRVASQNLMTALTSKKDEDWSAVSVDKLMNQISGLTRAVAYKKRVELQNKSDIEAGTGDLKSALWSAMAKERPDLYKQVSAYLDRKAQEAAHEYVRPAGYDRDGSRNHPEAARQGRGRQMPAGAADDPARRTMAGAALHAVPQLHLRQHAGCVPRLLCGAP